MRKYPKDEVVAEVAGQLRRGFGLPIHFVEKDWYITELLRHIVAFDPGEGLRLVFTGGTSLSKARNLLQRFSEEVDFVVEQRPGVTLAQSGRRKLRERLIEHLATGSHFTLLPTATDEPPW